jgi:Flp pilus assembly protein TadG
MNPSDKMGISRTWRAALACLWVFGAACEGLAAIEFALISPVMITLYFGMTELTDAFTANTKVTSVASTAGDLLAQEKSVCDAEMNDVFTALTSLMYPYPLNQMQIVISSLVDAGNNTVKVAWSDAKNTSPRGVNSIVAVPAGLVPSGGGGSVVLAEVVYNYSSPAGHLIYGTIPLTDKFWLHPRRAPQIARSANNC